MSKTLYETGLYVEVFPEICPYSSEEVLSSEFLPE